MIRYGITFNPITEQESVPISLSQIRKELLPGLMSMAKTSVTHGSIAATRSGSNLALARDFLAPGLYDVQGWFAFQPGEELDLHVDHMNDCLNISYRHPQLKKLQTAVLCTSADLQHWDRTRVIDKFKARAASLITEGREARAQQQDPAELIRTKNVSVWS